MGILNLPWFNNIRQTTNRKLFLSIVLCLAFYDSFSQTDSAFRISLILPFQSETTTERLDTFTNAHSYFAATKIHIDEEAITSLDFYQGVLQAVRQSADSTRIILQVYDCHNSDSITQEVLKDTAIGKSNIIIGAVSTSNSKLVAEYCKQHKIVNIQPFTPSKSLTSDNPYHLKLAPTIDSHVDALFNSIVDTFAGSNVIIYTPDVDRSLTVAQRFDSLFKAYNKTAAVKFTVAFLNTKTMLLNGKKTTATEQLKTGKTNVLIITSFDESFINGNLRLLHDDLKEKKIVVYGMPTWLSGDILRLDYINDFNTHLSDAFALDSTQKETINFRAAYQSLFNVEPAKYACLGFDAMNFILSSLKDYGKDFLNNISTQHYSGTGFQFDFFKNKKGDASINYYENRFVNVFKVENYQLKKVW